MSDPKTSLHYVAGGVVNGVFQAAQDGFNLADVSSVGGLNALPAGAKGLVYLDMADGATAAFKAAVDQYANNPKLYGFYLVDEPNPANVSAANLMAEADYIHAHLPGAKTFIVEQNMGSDQKPVFNFTPANTHIDLFGIDPYPVQTQYNGANDSIIATSVKAAIAAGIPESQIVPVYQAFGGGGYADWIMPTAAQEKQLLSDWGNVVHNPAFDYTYAWASQNNDTALSGSPELQAVFAAHNALGATSGATAVAPAAPVPTTPVPTTPVATATIPTTPVSTTTTAPSTTTTASAPSPTTVDPTASTSTGGHAGHHHATTTLTSTSHVDTTVTTDTAVHHDHHYAHMW